jgi:hypothetical protein
VRRYPRKTNPGVQDGVVQKKNRVDPSPGYRNWRQDVTVIDRRRPGAGYRHLLRKGDVERFIGLLEDWGELSQGLDAVVLAPGTEEAEAQYRGDVITIHAWPRELAQASTLDFIEDHAELLARLGVPIEHPDDDPDDDRDGEPLARLHWTEATARAYQLMHVFLHELGHHVDRMTTRSRRESSRGEDFAEGFALRRAEPLWPAYVAAFGEW